MRERKTADPGITIHTRMVAVFECWPRRERDNRVMLTHIPRLGGARVSTLGQSKCLAFDYIILQLHPKYKVNFKGAITAKGHVEGSKQPGGMQRSMLHANVHNVQCHVNKLF